MSEIQTTTGWKKWENVLFRFFFLFFTILILPIDWKFWRDLFSIDWTHLHFHHLFENYSPAAGQRPTGFRARARSGMPDAMSVAQSARYWICS